MRPVCKWSDVLGEEDLVSVTRAAREAKAAVSKRPKALGTVSVVG